MLSAIVEPFVVDVLPTILELVMGADLRYLSRNVYPSGNVANDYAVSRKNIIRVEIVRILWNANSGNR